MRSSSLLPSLSLLCSAARAGHHYIPFPAPANTCSIAEGTDLPNATFHQVTAYADIEHSHVHTSDCNHDIDLDSLFEDYEELGPNPWTHEPECLTDESTQNKYCVHTNASFAGGRGISIFTSPEIAAKINALPAFKSPLPAHVNKYDNAPFNIVNVPGRGNGLFAARTIERGELILADTPVGLYQSDALMKDWEGGYQFLKKTFDWLPEKTRKMFEGLSMHKEGDQIMERINTNSFHGEFGGEPAFMVYPETAMLNHDCRPNSMYFQDPNTLVHSTYAGRKIKKGEEITVAYINLLQPHANRTSTLKEIWGFDCTCALCGASSIKRQASDARIHQISQLQMILGDWTSTSTASPALANKLIKLYAKEKLDSALGTGHMFAALVYNSFGDVDSAKKHAQMAIDAGIAGTPDTGNVVREMDGILQWGNKHWSYNLRKSKGAFAR